MISHRFSTVPPADKIPVIERGRLSELGAQDEPVGAGGRYAGHADIGAEVRF